VRTDPRRYGPDGQAVEDGRSTGGKPVGQATDVYRLLTGEGRTGRRACVPCIAVADDEPRPSRRRILPAGMGLGAAACSSRHRDTAGAARPGQAASISSEPTPCPYSAGLTPESTYPLGPPASCSSSLISSSACGRHRSDPCWARALPDHQARRTTQQQTKPGRKRRRRSHDPAADVEGDPGTLYVRSTLAKSSVIRGGGRKKRR